MSDVSLEDFVYETLAGISGAVSRAQDATKERRGVPIGLFSVGDARTTQGEQLVKFHVSLEVGNSVAGGVKAEAGGTLIKVVAGTLGLHGEGSRDQKALHTVEFSVPMYFDSRWPDHDADR